MSKEYLDATLEPEKRAQALLEEAAAWQKKETAGRKTESVAKHFLAFHNSNEGVHGTVSDTPPRLLKEVYGKPFQVAIRETGRGMKWCSCILEIFMQVWRGR